MRSSFCIERCGEYVSLFTCRFSDTCIRTAGGYFFGVGWAIFAQEVLKSNALYVGDFSL